MGAVRLAQSGACTSYGNNSSRYLPVTSGVLDGEHYVSMTADQLVMIEFYARTYITRPGRFRALRVRATFGSRPNANVTLYKNGVATSLSVSLLGTSERSGGSDIVNVVPGDYVTFRFYGGISAFNIYQNWQLQSVSVIWEPEDTTVIRLSPWVVPYDLGAAESGLTMYSSFSGRFNPVADVTHATKKYWDWKVRLPSGVDHVLVKNLSMVTRRTSTFASGPVTVTVDGATGGGTAPSVATNGTPTLSFTLSDGTILERFSNTTDAVQVKDSDLLAFKVTTGTITAGTVAILAIVVEVEDPENGTWFLVSQFSDNGSSYALSGAQQTRNYSVSGFLYPFSLAASRVLMTMVQDVTVTLATASWEYSGGTPMLTLLNDTLGQAGTVSIPLPAASGNFGADPKWTTDTTGKWVIDVNDSLSWQFVRDDGLSAQGDILRCIALTLQHQGFDAPETRTY